MTEDAEAKAKELAALLEQIFGAESDSSLPEDPWELDPETVQSWRDIAAVLAAYPKGVPASKKNALIKRCQELTHTESPNPDLSVQVARMPLLGGHSTRVARAAVRPSTKKRTGLTRTGTPAVAAGPRQNKPSIIKQVVVPGYLNQEPAASSVASPQKLRQLEVAARMQQNKLDEITIHHSQYSSIKQQTLRAWQSLYEALASRLKYLEEKKEDQQTLDAYKAALKQVKDLVKNLDT